MFKINTKVEQYKDGYFIFTIVENEFNFDAWISHESYGRMEYMFGMIKSQVSKDEFIKIVEANANEYEDIIYEYMIKELKEA